MARFVSFRFDDGFLDGMRTAAACLAPDAATVFLIADLVGPGAAAHPEPLFQGRAFGSVADWRALSAAGTDVQLHGRSHRDLTALSRADQRDEVLGSLALTRQIHDGPFIFCHPYNRRVDLDYAALGLSGAGFATRSSDFPILYHSDLGAVDPFALTSWAVRERHFDTIADQLADLPDGSWVILAFHSLDGEGHEPWSAGRFRALVAHCRAIGLGIVTIGDMVDRLSRPLDA